MVKSQKIINAAIIINTHRIKVGCFEGGGLAFSALKIGYTAKTKFVMKIIIGINCKFELSIGCEAGKPDLFTKAIRLAKAPKHRRKKVVTIRITHLFPFI
jgi:hypothetical protein